MSIQLSKGEYDLLIKSIEQMSMKVDKIYEKVNHMDKKTVALEEWRKHHDAQYDSNIADYRQLKSRVSVLENYRWFLVGMSIAVSTILAILVQFFLR